MPWFITAFLKQRMLFFHHADAFNLPTQNWLKDKKTGITKHEQQIFICFHW